MTLSKVAGAAWWRPAGVVLLAALPWPALAAEPLEARIDRLERQLDSQVLMEMTARLDRLEQEVQLLRGQTEEQGNTIMELRQRERDLYLDIDRRLSRLEREGGAQPPQVAAPEPDQAAAPAAVPAPGAGAVAAAPALTGAAADRERDAYQQAFEQLQALRYEQAIGTFRTFLQEYPDGRYGHIAQYWLGEANYAQRNFRQAIIEYRMLMRRYPQSPKLADAMLKIGYSQYELNDKAGAQKSLAELVQRFPNSTEAGQADAFLQRMRGERQ